MSTTQAAEGLILVAEGVTFLYYKYSLEFFQTGRIYLGGKIYRSSLPFVQAGKKKIVLEGGAMLYLQVCD